MCRLWRGGEDHMIEMLSLWFKDANMDDLAALINLARMYAQEAAEQAERDAEGFLILGLGGGAALAFFLGITLWLWWQTYRVEENLE